LAVDPVHGNAPDPPWNPDPPREPATVGDFRRIWPRLAEMIIR
jgi:hypothetical protein